MSRLKLPTAAAIATFTRNRPAWLRFSGAAVATTLVVIGRVALNASWGRQHNRHLVFLPAIMLVSWLGRLGPAGPRRVGD